MIKNKKNAARLIRRMRRCKKVPYEGPARKNVTSFNMYRVFFPNGSPSCVEGHVHSLEGRSKSYILSNHIDGYEAIKNFLNCSRADALYLTGGFYGAPKGASSVTPKDVIEAIREMMQ